MSLWSRLAAIGLLSVGVLVVCSAAGLAMPVDAGDDGQVPETSFGAVTNHTEPVETNTTLRVVLQSNGDARWIITKQFNVTTENQTAGYEELADRFVVGEASGSGLGVGAFQQAINLVDAETNRSMQMGEINRTAATGTELADSVGELTLAFTWQNFARFEGEKLVIDDVLETEQGVWLPGLVANQTLVVKAPQGYGIDNANTVPRNGSLHWEGPTTFDNTTLQATFIGVSGTDPTETTTPRQNVSTPTEPDDAAGLALGVGLLAAIVVIVLLATNRGRIEAIVIDEDEEDEEPEKDEATPDDAAAATAGASDAADRDTAEDADGSESDDEIDVELLSDEERVERLLDQNGGRMKQATIVKETDWSNAKVSQLLSSMEDEGQINKLRIGRENLISFPDEDVADITDDE